MKRGDKVIAYPGPHEVKGEIVSDRLGFNAFEVRSAPILVKPTDKRRKRVTMVVHESNLARA